MSLPIFQRTIVDSSGNIQPGASVAVRNETTGELVTIYADREGVTAKANPFFADSEGFATFYIETGEYQVTATTPAGSITWSHVAIGDTALIELAQPTGSALVGFQQAGGVARTAESKMRESVSVKDFGALGDGTDATAEFEAAAVAAPAGNSQALQYPNIPSSPWACVTIPAGNYLLTSSVNTAGKEITWMADPGAVINGAQYLNGRLLRTGSKINDLHHGLTDSAVTFSVMANRNNDEVAPISGFTSPAQLSKGNGRDTVGLYVGNKAPASTYAAASVASFSATGAVLATPMTENQLEKMRVGMVVETRHTPQKFAGLVTAWTAGSITVSAWYLVDGSATGTAATPTGTNGIDINVFRKAWALNANVFIDGNSHGNAVNAFELGLRNEKGEPQIKGGPIEANGMYMVNLAGSPYYSGDRAYVAAGKWERGYEAWGGCKFAFSYNGNVMAEQTIDALLYGSNAAGVPFYTIKPDGFVEAGLRGSGTATPVGIDFHSGATDSDYDTRIQATGGNGTANNGTMTLSGATLTMATQTLNLSATTSIEVGTVARPSTDGVIGLGQAARRFSSVFSQNFRPGAGAALWTSGAGSPEGNVTAVVGSMFTRTDGGAGSTLYIKESGTGATGWVAE